MTTAWVTTLVTTAAALVGRTLFLLLTLVAQTLDVQPVRSIDVTLSRYAFSPERIEVRLGERIVLNVRSLDGAHGLQVKELGLDARVVGRGRPVSIVLTPQKAGTFQIACSEYCGIGHSRMKASFIVTPEP